LQGDLNNVLRIGVGFGGRSCGKAKNRQNANEEQGPWGSHIVSALETKFSKSAKWLESEQKHLTQATEES
jgi:hypothetical protein